MVKQTHYSLNVTIPDGPHGARIAEKILGFVDILMDQNLNGFNVSFTQTSQAWTENSCCQGTAYVGDEKVD